MLYSQFTILDHEQVVDDIGIKRRILGVKICKRDGGSPMFYGSETSFCRAVAQVGTRSAGEINENNTVTLL